MLNNYLSVWLILVIVMQVWGVLLQLAMVSLVMAGGGKKSAKSSKILQQIQPHTLTKLEDWYNLGIDTLKKACKELGLSQAGALVSLGRRLFDHYHGLSRSQQGKRVFHIVSGCGSNIDVWCLDVWSVYWVGKVLLCFPLFQFGLHVGCGWTVRPQ